MPKSVPKLIKTKKRIINVSNTKQLYSKIIKPFKKERNHEVPIVCLQFDVYVKELLLMYT